MNRGQRVPPGEKGSGSNSCPVMFKVIKICLMAWSQSLRTIPAHCSSARCPERKTPRARAGGCVGKEKWPSRQGGIPPAGHSARTVLEAGPLHLVCCVHRQAGNHSISRRGFGPSGFRCGQTSPPGGKSGKCAGFRSGLLDLLGQVKGNGDSLQQ